ncbi:hypothetical protein RM543_14290 [Roseicyclus sp. F158]|uniref:Chemotaxis protein n=1 Tax=Tropicimonas omnivorans TaxID=3075590 RepID=A0ABU3DJF7_9RHOB|nr:hypothetical protein [Roseicyclus sp. F158]MDT0683857.1 hypothetical protein [Roseicyclus sp. F158]
MSTIGQRLGDPSGEETDAISDLSSVLTNMAAELVRLSDLTAAIQARDLAGEEGRASAGSVTQLQNLDFATQVARDLGCLASNIAERTGNTEIEYTDLFDGLRLASLKQRLNGDHADIVRTESPDLGDIQMF